MSNILLLDLGNSRLKWALYNHTNTNQQPIESGILNVADITSVQLQQAWQHLQSVHAAYISAVGQQALQTLCAQAIKQHFTLQLHTIKVSAETAGVKNSYAVIENLGVDRWMGLLAAHHMTNNNAMIVSCGTATTIDIIDSSGQHQGGYIVPGLALMHRSIDVATADKNIQDVKNHQHKPQLADNTHGAIANGILHMQVALIESVYTQNNNQPLELYLTGGGADYIAPFLSVPYQLESKLVFKGMQVHIQAQQ